MAINVSQAFHRTSANPVDDTMALTQAEMLTVNDNLMPSKYFTVCQDDGKIYLYDKSNTADPETGKFRVFEGGGGDDANAYHTTDTAETTLADGDYFPFYDTSATGKRRTLWSNIKSVLKTYFDSLYQKALTAGTNISFSGTDNTTINATIPALGTIDRCMIYDGTEKVVGCWTDGKPLYAYTGGGILESSSSEVNTNLFNLPSGIDKVVRIEGIARDIDHVYATYACPFYASASAYCAFRVGANLDTLKVQFRGLAPQGTPTDEIHFSVTVFYTKTADPSDSYNYANENDYSTSEKIVGTWIDGKPVYQKTIQIGDIAVVSSVTYKNLGVTNADTLISSKLWYTFSDGNKFDSEFLIAYNYGYACPYIDYASHKIYMAYKTSIALSDMFAIIQYTKTTD